MMYQEHMDGLEGCNGVSGADGLAGCKDVSGAYGRTSRV